MNFPEQHGNHYRYREHMIMVNERENFFEADVHQGFSSGIYAFVYQAKSGNRTMEDVLFECAQVIDEKITWKDSLKRVWVNS